MQDKFPSYPSYIHNGRTAARRGWLAGLLVQRPQLLARLAAQYERLKQLPRRIRRQLQQRIALGLTGTALLLAFSHAPTRAADIAVVNGEVAVSDNGLCSLIEAIWNANDNATGLAHDDCAAGEPGGPDTITLPAGSSFNLTESYLNIYESETGLAAIRSRITIEGNGATIARDAADEDKFRLLAVAATGDLTLDQLTLSNGYTFTTHPDNFVNGGAIYNVGKLVIHDSTINGNTAGLHGGGVFSSGTLTISNSMISDNTAGYGGGGVSNTTGTLSINNSTISGNTSTHQGGGVFNSGPLTINDSIVNGNVTGYYGGGGVHNYYGMATIRNSIFHGNVSSGRGGAIINRSRSTITIEESELHNNSARFGGGLFNQSEGDHSATITNSTVRNNTAESTGGGILNSGGLMIIRDSTLSSNQAYAGGGLANDGNGNVTIEDSLLSDNTATKQGGGGALNSATMHIKNSTLSGNRGSGNFSGYSAAGGVSNDGGVLIIASSTISSNTALIGGGIDNVAGGMMTIEDSLINDNMAFSAGGLSNSGTLEIENSTFSGNKANGVDGRGGGLSNILDGKITIKDSAFDGNEAAHYGGGIENRHYGLLTIIDCVINNNSAGVGGGISHQDYVLTLTNSTISGNTADFGGGIYNKLGMLTITSSTVNGNTAERGGGVATTGHNNSTVTTINNSTLSGNSAESGGGAYNEDGVITFNRSLVTDNMASSEGGGVWNTAMSIINNSTLSGNVASGGGGVYNALYGMTTINNGTLTDNAASNSGGGMHNAAGSYSSGIVEFNWSVVSGNSAVLGIPEISNDGTVIANNFNLFGYGGDARSHGFTPGVNDVIPAVPLPNILDTTLQNNGYATETHALVPGSPAIDAAPSADCEIGSAAGGVDQRGLPRNADGDGRASNNECDIGAFELQSDLPTIHVNNLPFVTK